jgi:hypothetical protein
MIEILGCPKISENKCVVYSGRIGIFSVGGSSTMLRTRFIENVVAVNALKKQFFGREGSKRLKNKKMGTTKNATRRRT